MVEKLRGPKGEPITVSLLNGHLNLCLYTHRLVLFSDLIRDGCTVDGGHSETQPVKVKRITVGGVLPHKQDIWIPPLPKTQRPSWKT